MYKFDIVKDSTELRKAIAENPELPIVVMTSYDAVNDECYWTYCSIVHCEIGELFELIDLPDEKKKKYTLYPINAKFPYYLNLRENDFKRLFERRIER